ncbi:MAG: Spy/CpxP family protein refolding chaperone, partial [Balneolaceae bacterium]
METVIFRYKTVSLLAFITTTLFFVLEPVSLQAQANRGERQQESRMAMERTQSMRSFTQMFYSPQLIMRNQNEINLTETQRKTIQNLTNELHAAHTKVRWDLQNEMEILQNLLKSETVNLEEASSQLDKILALENNLKRTQFEMMVKIKNELTAEQQEAL